MASDGNGMIAGGSAHEERILILAPVGRDAELIGEAAVGAGLSALQCGDIDALLDQAGQGAAALVLTQEAIGPEVDDRLLAHLRDEPAWAALPVLLLVDEPVGWPEGRRGVSPEGDANHGLPSMNLLLLQRPMRRATLVSALRGAVEDRHRQYAVRDLLEEVRQFNATLETRVAERTQQVRDLAGELTRAEARERQRIAHLLHDDLQQMLAALRMKLQMADQASPDAVGHSIHEAQRLASEAIRAARSLSVQLAPPVLDSQGLEAALEWLVDHVQQDLSLSVDFTTTCDDDPLTDNREMRTLLFHVVRELLFNVHKHAGTYKARLDVDCRDQVLVIVVADDGQGFDPDQIAASKPGLGLASVGQRLNLIGGNVDIDSEPGSGTRVELRLPL